MIQIFRTLVAFLMTIPMIVSGAVCFPTSIAPNTEQSCHCCKPGNNSCSNSCGCVHTKNPVDSDLTMTIVRTVSFDDLPFCSAITQNTVLCAFRTINDTPSQHYSRIESPTAGSPPPEFHLPLRI